MANQMPPVPPASRSNKGPGNQEAANTSADDTKTARPQDKHAPLNQAEQDRHGNIKQNTTHQGYQQDR